MRLSAALLVIGGFLACQPAPPLPDFSRPLTFLQADPMLFVAPGDLAVTWDPLEGIDRYDFVLKRPGQPPYPETLDTTVDSLERTVTLNQPGPVRWTVFGIHDLGTVHACAPGEATCSEPFDYGAFVLRLILDPVVDIAPDRGSATVRWQDDPAGPLADANLEIEILSTPLPAGQPAADGEALWRVAASEDGHSGVIFHPDGESFSEEVTFYWRVVKDQNTPLPYYSATSGTALTLGFPASCDGWTNVAPSISRQPQAGQTGETFGLEVQSVAQSTGFEAIVDIDPDEDAESWSPVPMTDREVNLVINDPGHYRFRVRALRDSCAPTDWAVSEQFEVVQSCHPNRVPNAEETQTWTSNNHGIAIRFDTVDLATRYRIDYYEDTLGEFGSQIVVAPPTSTLGDSVVIELRQGYVDDQICADCVGGPVNIRDNGLGFNWTTGSSFLSIDITACSTSDLSCCSDVASYDVGCLIGCELNG